MKSLHGENANIFELLNNQTPYIMSYQSEAEKAAKRAREAAEKAARERKRAEEAAKKARKN